MFCGSWKLIIIVLTAPCSMTMVLSRQIPLLSLSPCFAYVLFIEMISCTRTSMSIECRVGRGAWGRWPAPRAQCPPAKSVPRGPAPRAPGAQGLARVTIPGSQGHSPGLFCPGLTRGLGWDARESRSGAARSALAVSRAFLRASALVRTRTLRRHVMQHATTTGWIKNDVVLVCISKMSARANASGALRWHAMLHIIHYPTLTCSAYRLCRFSTSFPMIFVTNSTEVCQHLGTCSHCVIICVKLWIKAVSCTM